MELNFFNPSDDIDALLSSNRNQNTSERNEISATDSIDLNKSTENSQTTGLRASNSKKHDKNSPDDTDGTKKQKSGKKSRDERLGLGKFRRKKRKRQRRGGASNSTSEKPKTFTQNSSTVPPASPTPMKSSSTISSSSSSLASLNHTRFDPTNLRSSSKASNSGSNGTNVNVLRQTNSSPQKTKTMEETKKKEIDHEQPLSSDPIRRSAQLAARSKSFGSRQFPHHNVYSSTHLRKRSRVGGKSQRDHVLLDAPLPNVEDTSMLTNHLFNNSVSFADLHLCSQLQNALCKVNPLSEDKSPKKDLTSERSIDDTVEEKGEKAKINSREDHNEGARIDKDNDRIDKSDDDEEWRKKKKKKKARFNFDFNGPTSVQRLAIPRILAGANVIVKSETGSGKTISYLAPILHLLQELRVNINTNTLANVSVRDRLKLKSSNIEENTRRVCRSDGTFCLVLLPTRELAHQVSSVLTQLLRATGFHWLIHSLLVGGEKKKSEKARLRKGLSIVIGTPGRVLDHLQTTSAFNVKYTRWLVLDEADRLLDMGFAQKIVQIYKILRSKSVRAAPVQLICVTATVDEKLNNVASEMLEDKDNTLTTLLTTAAAKTNSEDDGDIGESEKSNEKKKAYELIDVDQLAQVVMEDGNVDSVGGGLPSSLAQTPKQLVQHYVVTSPAHRFMTLFAFLLDTKKNQTNNAKIIVFFATCKGVDYHFELVKAMFNQPPGKEHDLDHINTTVLRNRLYRLHGNMEYSARIAQFKAFCGDTNERGGDNVNNNETKDSTNGILFCTDVAARGLDLPFVDWIIQYDPPSELSEYVHRVGRTARRGRAGRSLIILTPPERMFINLLAEKIPDADLNEMSQSGILAHWANPGGRKQMKQAQLEHCFTKYVCDLLQEGMSNGRRSTGKTNNINKRKQGMNNDSNNNSSSSNDMAALLLLAREAYVSYIRSYATASKELKAIFNVRRLHLGKVAKNYGLTENPKDIEHKMRSAKGQSGNNKSSKRGFHGSKGSGKERGNDKPQLTEEQELEEKRKRRKRKKLLQRQNKAAGIIKGGGFEVVKERRKSNGGSGSSSGGRIMGKLDDDRKRQHAVLSSM
eukprot:g1952.t1